MVTYHINTKSFTIRSLLNSLKARKLLPSRSVLKNKIDHTFKILEKEGFSDLEKLIRALKTKKKVALLSIKTGIDEEYLTLLRREINSYLPNPIPLNRFSLISSDIILHLGISGIKNTKQLYEANKHELLKDEHTPQMKKQLNMLLSLSDLSRLYGVGPVFAQILFGAGITSVGEFLQYTPEELIGIYEQKQEQKADFSTTDIAFTREVALYLKK